MPMRSIREMIASAIGLVVHTARLTDGSRKIIQISEITGIEKEADVTMQDIFEFKQTGVDPSGKVLGEFRATGHVPTFIEQIRVKGIVLPPDIFKPSPA